VLGMLWRTNDGGGVRCIYCFEMTLCTRHSGTALLSTGNVQGHGRDGC